MRLRHSGSHARPRHAAVGALALGTTLSVTALALAQAAPAPVSSPVPHAPQVRDATLRLGQRADVSGRFAASDAGRRIVLQYASRGHDWRPIAETAVEAGGRYRFRVRLKRSGAVRIALLPDGAAAVEGGAAGVAAAEAAPASRARRVAVAGRLVVGRRGRDVRAGAAVHVRGTLLPRTRGRRVVVEAGANGRWRRGRARAHARERPLRRAPRRRGARDAAAARPLRGRPPQRRRARPRRHAAGVPRRALASWYALYGGALACGGTLGYDTLGVAQQDAALRHEGDAPLPRPRGDRPGDRPRPVRPAAASGT